ncbi:Ist2 protein [Saccharomycopsis crataegensis]|uniref:Ist2 protein n=1 Tax=Saccharomycopsis crataegensis TaxID=43959 RepID=A0AAV5QDC7_9ASCO|nr:Ist2 protein [Saccharomycopsis crataegensis]
MEKVIDTSYSIGSLKPDFVISSLYTFDHAKDTPTKAANLDLQNLLNTLINGGFLAQIRPGSGVNEVILLVKLKKAQWVKILKNSEINDYLYGINNDLFDEDFEIDEADRLRIIYSYLVNDKDHGGLGIKPRIGQWDFVGSIQPIHDVAANKALIAKWIKTFKIEDNDIETIKNQYGSKIALYFVFLDTYLKWLIFPAIVGLANFIFFDKQKFSLPYTFLNLIWSIFFIQAWYNKEKNYSLKWNNRNVDSSSVSQVSNLDFKPSTTVVNYASFGNLKNFKYYPSYKRYLKKVTFVPIIILFAAILITWQLICFFVEIFITELYDGPLKSILALVPTVMLSVFVPIYTLIYKAIASKFVGWENHKTMLSLENSMNEKLFMISFLTSYMALIITSFVYFPAGHIINQYLEKIEFFFLDKVHPDFPIRKNHFIKINPQRMNGQFFFAMVTNQIIGFFLEYFLPFAMRFTTEIISNSKKEKIFYDYNDKNDEEEYLFQVRKQVYELDTYDVNDDIKQMVIQFGYLIFFSQCWTIAPFICLIVNVIQFFGDITKIFLENKRPIPTRTNSIYPWNQFMGLLVWVSSIIAPAITAMYSNSDVILERIDGFNLSMFEKSAVSIETWSLLAVIIFSEHLYLILTYALNILFSKIKSTESSEDLKNSLELKKKFISKYFCEENGTFIAASGGDDEAKWLSCKSDDEAALLELANKVVTNVKQSTKAKHTKDAAPVSAATPAHSPVPESKPRIAPKTEAIKEKIGASGAKVTEAVNELSQRKPSTPTSAVKEAMPKTEL